MHLDAYPFISLSFRAVRVEPPCWLRFQDKMTGLDLWRCTAWRVYILGSEERCLADETSLKSTLYVHSRATSAYLMHQALAFLYTSCMTDAGACMAGKLPKLDMGLLMYSILGAAVGLKIFLYLYCVALRGRSDSMLALAEVGTNILQSLASCFALAVHPFL